MRFIMIFAIMLFAATSAHAFGNPAQVCYSTCLESDFFDDMEKEEKNKKCVHECLGATKESNEKRIRAIYEEQMREKASHSEAYYKAVRDRAEFFKDCMMKTWDEDQCDFEMEAMGDKCYFDCRRTKQTKRACVESCGGEMEDLYEAEAEDKERGRRLGEDEEEYEYNEEDDDDEEEDDPELDRLLEEFEERQGLL